MFQNLHGDIMICLLYKSTVWKIKILWNLFQPNLLGINFCV